MFISSFNNPLVTLSYAPHPVWQHMGRRANYSNTWRNTENPAGLYLGIHPRTLYALRDGTVSLEYQHRPAVPIQMRKPMNVIGFFVRIFILSSIF